MNTSQGINFNEARETLEKLTVYINQKIARKNASSLPNSDINLATQPEIASDHLGEETLLTPVQEMSPTVDNPTVIPSATNEILASASQPIDQTQMQVNPIPQEVQTNVGGVMENIQPAAEVPEQVIEQPNNQLDTPQTQVNPIIQEVQPSVPNVMETNQLVQEVPEQPIAQTVEAPISNNIPQDGLTSSPETSTLNNASTTPELETIPNIDLSGVLTQNEGNVEALGTGNTNETSEGYKAMTNNATIGYPTEVPPTPSPVVMPNGMPQDMIANESVVVGPEAFSMTR